MSGTGTDHKFDRQKRVGEPNALVIASPASGGGKTTLTLALLRALKNHGLKIVSAKSGPDYIDPAFHQASSGAPCINLDAWAMDEAYLRASAMRHAEQADLLVIEGAMGLFDGAANGKGSVADLSAVLGAPVVLVVDCVRQSQSVAALVHGFRSFRSDVNVCGVILNRVASARHEAMLRGALAQIACPVFGALPRQDALILPERHLGLVQAREHGDLEGFIERAARQCEDCVDLSAVLAASQPLSASGSGLALSLPPLGQHVCIAQDDAFSFTYPHLLQDWRSAGTQVSFFSPLADEAPDAGADAIYLPGGYPELYAGQLAAAKNFKAGMQMAAKRSSLIYGECGGYMTLGETLVDAAGEHHEMLGLLPLDTSFAERKRHLGYRVLTPQTDLPWQQKLSAHEFHYASVVREGAGAPLFQATDANGTSLGPMGLRVGRVMGSFAHVIGPR